MQFSAKSALNVADENSLPSLGCTAGGGDYWWEQARKIFSKARVLLPAMCLVYLGGL